MSIPRDFSIVDGKGGEETLQALELVSKLALKFNFEQWLIEHAPQESHLQVQAGAGTGKTAVMIRRVDFLLHSVDGLALNDIAMITFTRDATHEMRSRLMDHLKTRHGVSGKAWYIDWLEQFPALNISTIHSLARRLLQSVCAEIGLGRSFRLNAFRQEKKRIIEDVLAAQISAQETISKVLRLPLYKFIENAVSFWEELSRKGLSLIDIEGIDWGNCTDADGARLQTIFSTLFAQAEAKLESLKLNQNSASLDDLTRQLATLASRRSLLGTGGPTFRYLFVDEFQDSDESQIRLVAALCRDFGAVLFVVGDIKQSIYRFRGATYTAFNALEKAISSFGGTLAEYTLAKNYRTASAVLDRLHPRFSSWNANGWLPYRSQDRLVPTVQDQGSFRSSGYRKKGERHQAQVLEWIREAADTLPTSGSDGRRPRAAVLVRTHREAELVHEWCSGAGIACEVRRGGDLFASEATYDLLALITAFLHPGDSVALLNLAATAYSEVHIPWPLLLRHKGDGAALRSAMENHQLTEHWAGLVETSRSEPVLSLLRSAIEHLEPSRRIRDRERERIAAEHSDWNEAEVLREANQAGIRYQLDLDRLVELMHKTFNENFASLYSVQEWLTVQRSVNREQERLDLPDEVLPAVLCTTVHASKGAEFHTVILPFTHRPFRFDRSELLLTQVANRWRAAWRLMVDEDSVITNSLYASSNQDEALEVRREETRLLYVAMTRCQRRLWICAFENSLATENWGDLLR
uniref:DNA 3'-5' helicase n=1 Tax=Solibacter usitatus (strain Ellin6076) TaxID=234267 RepID=Q027X4_SOLUE